MLIILEKILSYDDVKELDSFIEEKKIMIYTQLMIILLHFSSAPIPSERHVALFRKILAKMPEEGLKLDRVFAHPHFKNYILVVDRLIFEPRLKGEISLEFFGIASKMVMSNTLQSKLLILNSNNFSATDPFQLLACYVQTRPIVLQNFLTQYPFSEYDPVHNYCILSFILELVKKTTIPLEELQHFSKAWLDYMIKNDFPSIFFTLFINREVCLSKADEICSSAQEWTLTEIFFLAHCAKLFQWKIRSEEVKAKISKIIEAKKEKIKNFQEVDFIVSLALLNEFSLGENFAAIIATAMLDNNYTEQDRFQRHKEG